MTGQVTKTREPLYESHFSIQLDPNLRAQLCADIRVAALRGIYTP